jgi:hypothetical protein
VEGGASSLEAPATIGEFWVWKPGDRRYTATACETKEIPMGIEVGFLGLVLLALNIWAILNVVQSGASMGGKVIWILLILVFPLLGFVIWLFAGPRGSKAR